MATFRGENLEIPSAVVCGVQLSCRVLVVERMNSTLGSACLGAYTFCARQHDQEECDSKGLPLTPNSINIVGRFQAVLELEHRCLCAYLDIKRTSNGEHVMQCL